jgi:ankyrin repeat protein
MQQDGATPLFLSAQNGHKDTVLALLQAGSNVDAKHEVRGALLSLISRALARLLSLSSFALFFSLSFLFLSFFLNV